MAGEQSIQLINALAFARGTSEPTNRGVWWIDESITGNIYDKVKYFNTDSGEWELVQRSALQILEDLRGVDGEGSGLDADTLQGYTPAQLMSGGGGSVPALSTGELLVGQGDTIGTAQTISGIATINTTGVLSYVNGSISHTGLSDIGTNTHAQIDAKLASIDNIEGNLTNIGTLGAGQDGQALTWDNATSRFVMASPSGQNFANTDLTLTGARTHDLGANQLRFTSTNSASGVVVGPSGTGTAVSTMTIRNLNVAKTNVLNILKQNADGLAQFREDGFIFNSANSVKIGSEFFSLWGQTAIKGADTLPTSTAFEVYDGDTTPSKLWDFRNNGDVHMNQASNVELNGNKLKFKTSNAELELGGSSVLDRYLLLGANAAADGSGYYAGWDGSNGALFAYYGANEGGTYANKTWIQAKFNGGPMIYLNNSTGLVDGHWFNVDSGTTAQGNTSKRRFLIDSTVVAAHNIDGMVVDHANTGTPTVDGSAALEVVSTTKGLLFPRMTTTQKNAITTPATGLTVFDTTLAKLCVYTGAAWETVTSA